MMKMISFEMKMQQLMLMMMPSLMILLELNHF